MIYPAALPLLLAAFEVLITVQTFIGRSVTHYTSLVVCLVIFTYWRGAEHAENTVKFCEADGPIHGYTKDCVRNGIQFASIYVGAGAVGSFIGGALAKRFAGPDTERQAKTVDSSIAEPEEKT